MPYPLISTALGLCFALVWVFIAGMILRDGRRSVRQELDSNEDILPLALRRTAEPNVRKRARSA